MNQPKYITYKGAKYQKIDTLSEIAVEPVNRCCIIQYNSYMGEINVAPCKFKIGRPEKIAQDLLDKEKEEAIADGDTPPYRDGDLDDKPYEYDRYSYAGQIYEDDFFIVCTKGTGSLSYLYDLAEAYNAKGEYTPAHNALIDALDLLEFDN